MIKKTCALLIATWILALPTAFADASTIIKSGTDHKDYRALVLENGLKVLLVSDPQTDQAAASLDVHVGSGSDPNEWQGLAHLLEHMLFLGNQKYPAADQYRNFIEAHGGANNAYTSLSHTNYYFAISADYLLPALDRFAWFFIAPTFDETFVQRERAVVHSEYQARRKDESRRLWAARRAIITPAHPSSRFAVGSAHTLRDRDDGGARQKLIEFYHRHYSAELMTLTVLGKESLDQLEQWVTRLFAEIPARQAEVPLFKQKYLNPQLVASRLNLTPQQERLSVSFLFPIAANEAHYRSKPLRYVANLVGHEGEGSLFAVLDALGWAEDLSAGAGYMDKIQGTFEVSIQLTAVGLQHLDEIGLLLFQYIQLIKEHGVEAWRYQEQRQLAAIAFRFAEQRAAGATVRALAANLHRYPRADVLRGPFMMEQYRPALIHNLLAELRPDNVFLQVVAKPRQTAPNRATAAQNKTPFYEVEFDRQPIAPSTMQLWSRPGQDARLVNPPPNPFIAQRLALQELGETSDIPQRLVTEPGFEAWYRGDLQFGAPRAAFYFNIKTPLANNSARNLVLTELLVRMVNQQLNPGTYAARLAGLNYSLYRHHRGLSVRIHGYADKQSKLLKTVLAGLLAPRLAADQFALRKAELKRELNNVALQSPSRQSVHEIYRLLLHPYWSEAERLAELEKIDLHDLRTHAARLLAKVNITTLSHGDVTRAQAVQLNALLKAAFADAQWLEKVSPAALRMLPAQRPYLRSLEVAHDDSAVAVYFQGRGKSDFEMAKMSLLARLLESPFFFNLRTTNQVGYLVYAAQLNILDAPGLLFSVQSPTHTPSQINRLINQFVDEFGAILARMDERAFTEIKQGLLARILTRDPNLSERTNRYWREIDARKFKFDARARLSAAIERLDRDDMRAYFQQIIQRQARKLLVQAPSQRLPTADQPNHAKPYTRIRSLAQFRNRAHSFFPAD